MTHPIAYLTFDGDCADAFQFYADVLAGQIESIHHVGDSPMADELPPDSHDRVMHAQIRFDQGLLMGSDAMPGQPAPLMSGFHLSLNFDDLDDACAVFEALAEDGTITMALQATFWAEAYGTLIDRYGVPWMINCEGQAGEH